MLQSQDWTKEQYTMHAGGRTDIDHFSHFRLGFTGTMTVLVSLPGHIMGSGIGLQGWDGCGYGCGGGKWRGDVTIR